MDITNKPQIIKEIIEVIKQYDCTFEESRELLLNTGAIIKNSNRGSEVFIGTSLLKKRTAMENDINLNLPNDPEPSTIHESFWDIKY